MGSHAGLGTVKPGPEFNNPYGGSGATPPLNLMEAQMMGYLIPVCMLAAVAIIAMTLTRL